MDQSSFYLFSIKECSIFRLLNYLDLEIMSVLIIYIVYVVFNKIPTRSIITVSRAAVLHDLQRHEHHTSQHVSREPRLPREDHLQPEDRGGDHPEEHRVQAEHFYSSGHPGA